MRKRLEYPALKRAVAEQAERFRPANILIEDKASGTQLIQELIYAGVHGVTRYDPKGLDKTLRLQSVTSTLENGFVYLPSQAEWLATYVHELTTFPRAKHDDQADSTSQALDWLKPKNQHGVLEHYRREVLAQQLRLPPDYRFLQCDEGEEIIAGHITTGHKIRWDGHTWVDVECPDKTKPPTCPACGGHCFGTYAENHRCHECRYQWPVASLFRKHQP